MEETRQPVHRSRNQWLNNEARRFGSVEDSIPRLAARLDELEKRHPFLSQRSSQHRQTAPYSPVAPISPSLDWSQSVLRVQSPDPPITVHGIPYHEMSSMAAQGDTEIRYRNPSASPFPIFQPLHTSYSSVPATMNPPGIPEIAIPNTVPITESASFPTAMDPMTAPGNPESQQGDQSTTSDTRSGRRGKLQCGCCRAAKRNYDCIPIDPTDPASKCTKCRDRKILHKCTGRHWPPGKSAKIRNEELQATQQSEMTQLSNRVDALQETLGTVVAKIGQFEDKLEDQAAKWTRMIRKVVSSRARQMKFK